jgi:pyochelin synthetase
VMIEHFAALTTIDAVNRKWTLDGNDRTLALSSLSFDLSVFDIFGPLSVGGTVVVPTASLQPDPDAWARDLTTGKVTVWNTAPALMALMLEHRLPADHQLRLIMLSGDWVPLDTIRKLREQAPNATLIALGGATEAAIWSNYHEIGELDPDWHSIPYGTPLDGHNLHVVARDFSDLPDWTIGDIEIAGAGLARGYLGEADRTNERFRTDARTGDRRYVTGDIGRFRPYNNGQRSVAAPIEFLGREDFQVKIQGYRIELGEVEHVMEQCPGVSRAIATVFASGAGSEKILAGFVVPTAQTASCLSFDEGIDVACSTLKGIDSRIDDAVFDKNAVFLSRQTGLAVAEALRKISGSDTLPDIDVLIDEHGVAPRYRDWLTRTLALVKQGGWRAGDIPSIKDLPGENQFGFGEAELGLLDSVIENLPDLLTEKKHSSDIYLSAQTPDVYATLFDIPNKIIAAIVRAIAGDMPLRVLELGAGLGTTFSALGEVLGDSHIEYHFTDISPAMLTLAGRKFGTRQGLHYGQLDMMEAPQVAAEPFDVVIATNALHVAPDIAVALTATRMRLKPGGLLIAFEPTRFFPWYDLNMGLQSGFDDRTDRNVRPDHPLLSRNLWHSVLQSAGFDRVKIPVAEDTLTDRLGFDVILACAPQSQPGQIIEPKELQTWLSDRLPAYMVPRQISLIDKLPLSANGKIDRASLHLPDLYGDQVDGSDEGIVISQITDLVSSCLGTPVTETGKSLFELGATSLSLVALQRQIGEKFGRTVPLQAMFEDPSIANLVRIILGNEVTTSPVIRFSRRIEGDLRPELMMMPGIFALPFFLKDLANILQPYINLVSIQLPGLFAAETPLFTIESQADYVIAQMKQNQPKGPYFIGGYSYGGTIAFEVARKLRLTGDEVPMVLLADTLRTRTKLEAFQGDEIAYTAMVRGLLALYSGSLGCGENILEEYPARAAYDHITAELSQKGILGPVSLPADRMAAMFKANFKALGQFVPQALPGDLTLIRTEGGFPPEFRDYEPEESLQDEGLGWSEFVDGRLDVHSVPGDHLSLMAADTLEETAQLIRDLMKVN